MIQQLHRHLDIRRRTRNDHQPLSLPRRRRRIQATRARTRLHDLDLTRTHMPDLVDLAPSLADDTTHEIIRDVDLLRLDLRGRVAWGGRGGLDVGVGVAGDVGGADVGGAAGGRAVGGTIARHGGSGGGHAFLGFDEDVADVVRGDVDCVGDACDAEHALDGMESETKCERVRIGSDEPL